MAINFEKALGLHPAALRLRAQRADIISNNLINADTPGFQARDIDFRETLRAHANAGASQAMIQSNQSHLSISAGVDNPQLKYRIPMQSSQDNNTVTPEVEYSKFAENALRYEASLRFLSGRFSGLKLAIKGE